MIRVRPYRAEDAGVLGAVFFEAVRIGAAPKYTAEQREAWAPERPSAGVWAARLAGLVTLVAEGDSGVLGFMALRGDGYLDLAFLRPDQRGKGVADALLRAVLDEARARGLTRLTTEASAMARSFFLRHDWQDLGAQEVVRRGVSLENFRMALELGAG